MTPVWHDGPLAGLVRDGAWPIAWSIAETGPIAHATLSTVRPMSEDHADAALVRDGAGRLSRRLLARALLSHVAAVPVDTVRLSRTPAGAPVVVSPAGWHIGVSSRDGHALIAVATQPVAVDREPIDDAEPLWDMLTPTEATDLRRLPPAERPAAWLRRWTIKEAHAKLIGEPRRIVPDAIETIVHDATTATAFLEGTSRCWTRIAHGGIETLACWPAPEHP